MSGEEAIRALERIGFARRPQTGSHVVLRRFLKDGEVRCVVPRHRDLATGTLPSILRQAGVDRDEFLDHL